jgi:hypothetical protein
VIGVVCWNGYDTQNKNLQTLNHDLLKIATGIKKKATEVAFG